MRLLKAKRMIRWPCPDRRLAPAFKMPEISRFFGIIVAMYYDDHAPPHFHVRYGKHRAIVEIDRVALLAGRLPPRALGLVMEWATLHQEELEENWRRAREQAPLKQIPPLE
jgi:hypothetical protein